jgi:DNA-binding MurR/RpiR family transcriptional regulator
MAFFLSKVVKYPRAGNPVVNELIGNLRETAHGTANEAIARAADVIRKGDRIHLVIVLSGAAFIGWLLAHQSQR